jgi:hypothetical protein
LGEPERRWQALCIELKLAGELIRTTEGSAAQDHGRFCQPWYPCRHVVIYDALTYTQRGKQCLDNARRSAMSVPPVLLLVLDEVEMIGICCVTCRMCVCGSVIVYRTCSGITIDVELDLT